MIKAIFFDFDGTLIDCKEIHFNSLNKALNDFRYESISREDHENKFCGLPTASKLKILNIEKKEDIENIKNKKQHYTMQEFELIKNDKELIDLVSILKIKDYKLACCTNSVKETVIKGLENLGIKHYFDLILSNEDVLKPKPDPEIYSKAVNFFNISPKECLVIEDNDYGVASAKSAGTKVLKINERKDLTEINIMNYISNLNVK